MSKVGLENNNLNFQENFSVRSGNTAVQVRLGRDKCFFFFVVG